MGSNADEKYPWVKLMQADDLDQLKQNFDRGDDGNSYPGLTGNRKFSTLSNPNSKSYGGAKMCFSVANMSFTSSTATFDITVKKGDQSPANGKGLVQMAATGEFSGHCWQLGVHGDGNYFLQTLFLGPNRRLGVQVDKKTPSLELANESARAQYRTIAQWDHPKDGTKDLDVRHRG
ncbi:hypothetical protein E8E12_005052 [Didymella heteroderae]|uniref:Uncharacterized protein n=1 Tax=Didymella heteroderae TaxID=1769908 RepID=A0A9P4WJ02_9PLEO|nr:hypothetical protein E8E12_005052 [Didymella heteroderae]